MQDFESGDDSSNLSGSIGVKIMSYLETLMKNRDDLLKETREKRWEITKINQQLQVELQDAIYKLGVLSKYKWMFQPNGGHCGDLVYTAIIPKGDEYSLLNLVPTGEDDDYGYDRTFVIVKDEVTITASPVMRKSNGHVTLILKWDTALKTIKKFKLKVCGDYSKVIEEKKERIDQASKEIDILNQLNKLG